MLPSHRIDELCECCEIENRLPRQLNETMRCWQNVFAMAMDELRENLEMCRSPIRKAHAGGHLRNTRAPTEGEPHDAAIRTRRRDAHRGRRDAGSETAEWSTDCAPELRGSTGHRGPAAQVAHVASCGMGHGEDGSESSESEQTEPTEGMDSRTMRRAAVALSR